ncbi:MAG TPA: FAD-dependent oxidoreductase [Pyrinomonadaceae bacterium]|nr:FAD-dependent oxidoreductase [Pyrinomonadaceae bacterium]
MKRNIPRRDFLKHGASAAAAALVVPARVSASLPRVCGSWGFARTAAPAKVVVLGAGLAGLAAGYELTKAGYDVLLLEAQKRPGGRVLTLRVFDGGMYADAGAARIPDNHEWTLRYVKEFGLRLLPFYPEAGLFVRLKKGRRAEVNWAQFRDAVEDSVGVELGEGRGWHKVEGGNDLLPRAFAQKLDGQVIYGAAVTRVEQNAGGVRVTFDRGGGAEYLAADYAVCAIPFAVLGRVEFAPALSERKRKVRDEMTYEMAARAFLQCRGRFWERGRVNGFAVSDLPAEFWPSTFGQRADRAILQAYVRHFTALQWAKKPEPERVNLALEMTEQALPGARADFERGAVKCWGEDEWAGCAWTHPSGPQLVAVNAPEGRIHFAGEHASVYASWMNGALESGNRAARAVAEAARAAAA